MQTITGVSPAPPRVETKLPSEKSVPLPGEKKQVEQLPGEKTSTPLPGEKVQSHPVSDKALGKAIDAVNKRFEQDGINDRVSLKFDAQLKQLVVQVTDKATGNVLRQFPSKDAVSLYAALSQMSGALLDKQG